jgi:hypothetical protein
MKLSLGDYILDRTESLEDKLILEYFIEKDNSKIQRLIDSEQYLLEGSRGVGKTMLMKAAMLKSQEKFGQNSILPVWVSFEESIRLERIKVINNTVDPFLQWTMGKILYETLNKISELQPKALEQLNKRLSKIFNEPSPNTFSKYTSLLNDYIRVLERGEIENNNEVTILSPSVELTSILDNPQTFREFLLELIKDYKLQRIVFLFDEAAHVFSYSQQEKFFTFFKTLRNPSIACKAAVYPGITNYGKYFERGQDAKEIRIDWSPIDSNDINYIKDILKKRIKAYDISYWHKLTTNKAVLDLIAICSNGNPRFAFHIIDELESNKAFKSNVTSPILINSIRTVFNTKWKEFDTLKQRLVRFEKYITEAESFMKETILPNLRLWNEKQRETKRKLSLGFYISTRAFDLLEKVFSVLAYSNIIGIDYSKRSLGHHKYGYYVTINPSTLFTDLIIKDVSELQNTSIAIENNQTYTELSIPIKELISQVGIVNYIKCSNSNCDFKTKDNSFKFCPKCGSKMDTQGEEESLYKILRSHSLSNLKLSPRIIRRLKQKFDNIGELYDCDIEELRMKYIQDVRINLVRNSVLEYMSG